MTQAEFEAVGLHVLNSQATGDLIYASSISQLSRLGIGSTNDVLHVAGGIPAWSATLAGITLTSPTINGTIATTGLTMPLHTSGAISFNVGDALLRTIDSDALVIRGATQSSGSSPAFWLWGRDHAQAGALWIATPDAAGTGDILRFTISGKLATAVATWSVVTQTGLDITSGSSLKYNGTQVIGARVVDARCDDAINSGDATTDGVIDSLRDAMVAHGLVAAA